MGPGYCRSEHRWPLPVNCKMGVLVRCSLPWAGGVPAPRFSLSNITVPGTGFATIFHVGIASPTAVFGVSIGSTAVRNRSSPQQNACYFGSQTVKWASPPKNGMNKPWPKPDSWVLYNFPDAKPTQIVGNARRSPDLDEYRRAIWLWQRRPSEISIIVHLLIFGIGALIHIPLILADDFVIFAIYHTFYVVVVCVCVGRFLWLESQYRRWRQDYLRSLARLENTCER
jgi:hypothetical protein